MKKLFHILVALCSVVYFAGSLVFVFGQAVALLLGQPELIISIESGVDAVIFPTLAITGLLCYLYSIFYKKKSKKKD